MHYIRRNQVQKGMIHKNILICSIEITPMYYEDYLKKLYLEAQINPVDTFRKIDQTSDFPEMSQLLTEIKGYRGEGIALADSRHAVGAAAFLAAAP